MAIRTQQLYRLSVRHNGRLFKALSHSVEEDESLFVMNRNPPRPRHITSGIPTLSQSGLRLESRSSTDMRSHHVHYHPSGALIVKARDNATIARIQAPPMPMISKPFLMYFISVAHVEQLAADTRKPALGDHAIDLSQMQINRLHIECLVGPKGAFNGPLQWAFGPAQRVVYEDAGFYDVAYFAGEAPPIDPTIEINGIRLKDTCLTGALSTDIADPSNLPHLTPVAWASPSAVARQLRASLESRVSHLASRLGQTVGCYEIKISVCNNGVIAAIDWNSYIRTPQFSLLRSDNLCCEDVLRVIRGGPSGRDNTTMDVFDIKPDWCGRLRGTVFVRARRPSVDRVHNALVLRGSELLPGRYWRIEPSALINIDKVIDLIHSYA